MEELNLTKPPNSALVQYTFTYVRRNEATVAGQTEFEKKMVCIRVVLVRILPRLPRLCRMARECHHCGTLCRPYSAA
jgi:hypothetical protein